MTHLRQIMLEELRRRNYAESTIHIYIHMIEYFSRRFHRSPDGGFRRALATIRESEPLARSLGISPSRHRA